MKKLPQFVLVLVFIINAGILCHAQRALSLKVSNDMTYFTDRYFSNGIVLQFYDPAIRKFPVGFLFLPHSSQATVHWSFSVTHHMYTPTNTYTAELKELDHPYSSYLLFGLMKESWNWVRQLKTTSELKVGWIGPAAGGEAFQNTMHANISIAEHVEGWHYQVANDFCLQVSLMVEKGIIHAEWFEARAFLEGRFGSPHNDARIGAHVRAGLFKNYFQDKAIFNGENFQVWLFSAADVQAVHFDATLQGGLYNRNNPHTIESITPLVYHLAFGGALQFKSITIELAQEVDSPRFQDMGWHRWACLSCAVRL